MGGVSGLRGEGEEGGHSVFPAPVRGRWMARPKVRSEGRSVGTEGERERKRKREACGGRKTNRESPQ